MEKQDIMYGILAFGIILVIALVIKPMATGQSIDLGLPVATATPTPDPAQALPPLYTPNPVPPTVSLPPAPTSAPTPQPTWDPSKGSLGFVDPSQYGVSLNQSPVGGTRIENVLIDTNMTTLATVTGRYSGTTETFFMPYPYWEIWYTVEPYGKTGGKDQKLSTSTVTGPKLSGIKGSGSSQTIIEGSYAVTNPQFSLQVMDGNDPNRIVRSFAPPGGIDKDLWTSKTIETDDSDKTVTIPDPRPWKEKFYEGERNYFFIVNSQSLDSYRIELKVPTRYLRTNATTLQK